MKSIAPLLLCVSLFVGNGTAKGQEYLEELQSGIIETESQQAFLLERLSVVRERLALLKEMKTQVSQVVGLERQLEQAEQQNDERATEQLEGKLFEVEIKLDENDARLEVLEYKTRLAELQLGLRETKQAGPITRAASLAKIIDAASKTITKLYRVYRDGPESSEQPLEEELQSLRRKFDQGAETLQLQLELFWAREEGDAEAVEELQRELKTMEAIENVDKVPKETAAPPVPVRPSEKELQDAERLTMSDDIGPLLETYCFQCHNAAEAAGDLNIEAMVQANPIVRERTHLLNAIEQIRVRSMPPADAEQPDDLQRRRLVAFLTSKIEGFDYESIRQPGREPARRLTHQEYDNTVRDLTGVDVRPASSFPVDMSASSGFENSANSLFIQPILMERYIGAAERIVREAFPEAPKTQQQKLATERLLRGTPKEQITRFTSRAYRRPVSPDELQSLLGHYESLVSRGTPASQAIRDTIQIILVSPKFLIRSEQYRPDQSGRISDFELASRLSYFLWASMPDTELFRAAADQSLSNPETLDAQIRRMLADDRSRSLGTIFAAQWLRFSELDRVQRDQIDNPWATDSLVAAMADESALLFHSLIRHDAPIERLLNADYTFLNEELANHYRIKNVVGNQMRKVSLRGTPRGGILGHGSILAITSYPHRASPVLRGNWILTELLGTPPPPPPPNVSQLEDRVAEDDSLSQREKMQLHRRNPNCYACHNEIDPLGFAMSEFEWFGRHRPERSKDAVGTLPSGRQVERLTGLRDALIEERLDDLIRQLTQKMLAYALGRQLEYFDEATVRDIMAEVKANNRSIRSLIRAIVHSKTFRYNGEGPQS